MRNLIRSFVLLAALVPAAAHAKLKVVTTAPDFADLARQIGGEHVEVHSVMRGPENVHNVLAAPTEMLKLNRADLFVHAGLDAEPWRANLLKGARNPRVMPGKPGNVDMSQGIELRDVPAGKVDRSMGDVHAFGDPHYTADPRNGQRMVATLARAMADADPDHAEAYRANAKRVVNELADLHRDLRERAAAYRGLKVATYHRAWGYFADAFGFDVVTTIEPQPGITPSPAQLADTIRRLERAGAKVVIVETYSNHDQAKHVADAIGGRAVVLPSYVNGVADAKSYQDLFRHNVERVLEAARSAGVEPTK
jgi:ABC-type Zn uptake system ZnuABC Zn-binding protein ZnuA